MARRLHKSLVDYLVIAISPALIMALVGSLVFFLIEVFYQGNFQGRLHYIFALFVMGAVLVGRISIEEGRERAVLFAVPLAIAILLAINKFVEFQGGLAGSLSFLINCGLIGIVWWSADKLTWDCTLIDESEEDSGEGLLQSIGFERRQGHCTGRVGQRTARNQSCVVRSRAHLVATPRPTTAAAARAGRVGRLFLAGGAAAVRTWATLYPLGRFIGAAGCLWPVVRLHGQRFGPAAVDELLGTALPAAARRADAAGDGRPVA